MSRRIDIELTSDRGDGTWTWRAAGAKQPKGVLQGTLLPADATVGQQLRADVEVSLDGTDVLAVLPPKTKNRASVETIELIARPLKDDELVTQKLAGRGGRDRGDRGERGDRRGGRGRDGDRGPRGDRDRGPRGDRDRGPRGDRDRGPRGDRPGGDRPRGDRDRDRGPRSDRPRGDRPDRPRRERPAPPPRPKAKRLRAGRAHRKAALDLLAPEEQVIAEQLLLGGIPAVRQAVEKQNAQAKAEGTRLVSAEPLLAIAERLLPPLRAAEWRDKAEAALADLDELDLRDLRSVVVAADSGAKDDESRALASQLRDGLTARLDKEHNDWLTELADTLKDGRTVRALRLSSRPPKAGAPLPADLAAKLAEATSASLTAETVSDRWATVLDALSFSPVRLSVVPASKPETPSEELIAVITRMADRVPKVAEAFGIEPSAAPRRRGRGGSGRKPKAASGGAPAAKGAIPPPPERPAEDAPAKDAPVAEADVTETETTDVTEVATEAPATDDATAPAEETPAAGPGAETSAPEAEVEASAPAEETPAPEPEVEASAEEPAAADEAPAAE